MPGAGATLAARSIRPPVPFGGAPSSAITALASARLALPLPRDTRNRFSSAWARDRRMRALDSSWTGSDPLVRASLSREADAKNATTSHDSRANGGDGCGQQGWVEQAVGPVGDEPLAEHQKAEGQESRHHDPDDVAERLARLVRPVEASRLHLVQLPDGGQDRLLHEGGSFPQVGAADRQAEAVVDPGRLDQAAVGREVLVDDGQGLGRLLRRSRLARHRCQLVGGRRQVVEICLAASRRLEARLEEGVGRGGVGVGQRRVDDLGAHQQRLDLLADGVGGPLAGPQGAGADDRHQQHHDHDGARGQPHPARGGPRPVAQAGHNGGPGDRRAGHRGASGGCHASPLPRLSPVQNLP